MHIGRINLKEITLNRIFTAIKYRYNNSVAHFFWKKKYGVKNAKKIEKYKDIHKGERCFVVANGPSLKKMDLSFLKDEYSFGMNRIYLLFDELGFKTTYHCCVNELVLEQFAPDIDKLDIPKFLNWNRSAHFQNEAKTQYLKMSNSLNDQFSTDLAGDVYSGGTVTYVCLQLAFYMGFEEVVIIGMDHNFKEKGTPNKVEVREQEKDESHFHPDYFPKGVKWQLPDLVRSEMAYAKARDFYEEHGRQIMDATIGGKCDVFTKKSFDRLIQKTT